MDLDHPLAMADGFDIHVGSELARRIAEEAKATGQTPEGLALAILDEAFEQLPAGDSSLDWSEDVRRAEQYDREGGGVPLEEALAEVRALIDAKVNAKG